ncbi:cation-translocating P-type ATPase [Aquipuribacter sp. SD81]|uniref:cation-translocating P-type ATPase n=1 Tax=Aquipuribacter sp. SD81 TaxID=3127703 RepID=UPI00301A8469
MSTTKEQPGSRSGGAGPGGDPGWHAREADDVAAALGVEVSEGLGDDEVRRRLDEHGRNVVQEAEQTPWWRLLLAQFADPLVVILLVAAVVAGAVGDLKDPIVIGVVLLLNAGIGFYQENQAQHSMSALQSMLTFSARVRRGGRVSDVEGSELVPGDVVVLRGGDRVPADGRLVRAKGVQVEESALTGEAAAVDKTLDVVDADAPLAERHNRLFMNTTVARGEAEMVVTETGMATEVGRIAERLREEDDDTTPLQRQLRGLTVRLAVVAGVACALVFALGLLQGDAFADVLLDAVALAVAAVPEGLPAVVTVTLAVGMNQMAKRNAIVKRLVSVETLGSTTVICTDKTGTLTLNEMTAREVVSHGRTWEVSGEGYDPEGRIGDDGEDFPTPRDVFLPVVLCSDAEVHDGELKGEPTEGALLVVGLKAGVDADEVREAYPRVATVPFDSARKYMATFHVLTGEDSSRDGEDEPVVLVKGAPDVVLPMCATWWGADGKEDLDDERREQVREAVQALSEQGRRVLAVASRAMDAPADADADEDALAEEHVHDLHLQAVVGIVDPARPEAAEAISTCTHAGITVKMITGDHKVTASAIAADLGIATEAAEGRELDGVEGAELDDLVQRTGVFARVSPDHKVRIVEALRERGEVVAMTGDGVNDAAALKAAHIGVAMGRSGTDVAKEAGEVVLTDDNFATIVNAVERGRAIYDNIVKFVRFQLSTNIGAILAIVVARAATLPTPFSPVQILWVNIIMDGPPALALGVDPPDPDVMERRPRDPDAHVLDLRRLLVLALIGATMAAGTLAMFLYGELVIGDEAVATTMAFSTFVLFQVVNAFNARSETATAFRRHSLANGRLLVALAAVLVLQVLVVHVPVAQPVFDTTALTLTEWLMCAGVATSVLLVEEVRKAVVRARRR